jgi:hypothetical protein
MLNFLPQIFNVRSKIKGLPYVKALVTNSIRAWSDLLVTNAGNESNKFSLLNQYTRLAFVSMQSDQIYVTAGPFPAALEKALGINWEKILGIFGNLRIFYSNIHALIYTRLTLFRAFLTHV